MHISAKDLLLLLLILLGQFPVFAQKVDEQFNPFIKNAPEVTSLAIQSDGKILVGGGIASVGNRKTSSLVRLHPNGMLDTTFKAKTDGYSLYNVKIGANEKIFSREISGNSRGNVIQLNNDGSKDDNFNLDDSIHIINRYAVQRNKYIVLEGAWESDGFHGRVSRIDSSGKIDTSFTSMDINGEVYSLEALDNGEIIIITKRNENSIILKLNENGKLNENFNSGIGFGTKYPSIKSVKSHSNGKIIISGSFTKYNNTETGGFIRLNQDGSLDNSFVIPGPTVNIFDHGVKSMFVLASGKILVVGGNHDYEQGNFDVLARLNSDGSLDTSFSPIKLNITPGFYSGYSSIAAFKNIFYLSGAFNKYNAEKKQYGVIAIDADGKLINTFKPDLGSKPIIKTALRQPDGKVVIAGNFIEVNNTEALGLARLTPNGSLDTIFANQFKGGVDRSISSLALQLDGKLLVGGSFNKFNNIERRGIVRLNPDGSMDTSFNLNINFTYLSYGVSQMHIQNDEKILIGGRLGYIDRLERPQIARINKDGSIDDTFAPNIPSDYTLYAMTIQNDKILTGGVNRNSSSHAGFLAKLDTKGSMDSIFQEVTFEGHGIYSIESISEKQILCAGGITTGHGNRDINPLFQVDGQGKIYDQYSLSSNGFGTFLDIFPLSDSIFIVGGNFQAINKFERFGLAKIDLKGRVYGGFRADVRGDVQQILPEDEDHILVYGNFDEISNIKGFSGIARINISAPRSPMDISVDLDGKRGVELSWKDSADVVNGYKIYRGSSNGAGHVLIDSVNAGVTSYLDTDIEPGLTYSYQVVSYNENFQSDFSDPVSVSTSALSQPETPSGLTVDDGSGNVYLTWQSDHSNVTGYIIERSDGKGFVVIDTVTVSNFQDQEVTINVEYQYRVKAYNVVGESGYSSPVSYINQVTGFEPVQEQGQVKAYPNPSDNVFTISLEQSVDIQNVQIVNMLGQQLSLPGVVVEHTRSQLKIDLSDEINGVYIVSIKTRQKVVSYRLLKR